jgi:hypothetical protein
MNLLLMGAMMALMLVFFHGRGHHQPSPSPEHHTTTPREATAPPSPGAPGVSHQSGESRREPNSDPKAPGEADPAPPAPKAE